MAECNKPIVYRPGQVLSTLDLRYLKLYAHIDEESNILGVFVVEGLLDSETRFVGLYKSKPDNKLKSNKVGRGIDLAIDIVVDLNIAEKELYYESYDIWFLQ